MAVFSLTLFMSASLMFAVQPMAGKMLLPLVGGAPAGWVVAMAFFQVALLAGYLLAHAFSKFSPRQHAMLYILALAAGLPFLPVSLDGHAGLDTISGPGKVFLLLAQALAIPFIALSATSSTLQRLFTATGHESSNDPYFLYVASNLGSFAGLLLYPFLIEPLLPLDKQSGLIAGGYVALILLGAVCIAFARKDKTKASHQRRHPAQPLAWKTQGQWLALSFLPSSLLMSVMTYITSDIISAPLVWILPLALYLLTFVIAFSQRPLIPLRFMEMLHPYVICVAILFISLIRADWLFSWFGVFFYLVIFTAIALTCHLRLAALRPREDNRHLTAFYLLMSVGGALGGVLNAFLIPNILNRLIEFPLFLLASFLIHRDFDVRSKQGMAIIGLLLLALVLANAPHLLTGIDTMHARVMLFRAAIFLAPVALFLFRKSLRPTHIALAALALFMISQFAIGDEAVLSLRNFFGTVRLYDSIHTENGKDIAVRVMRHGSTSHGLQLRGNDTLETTPTAYFSRQGPLGDVFRTFHPRHVAVLGLGAGVTNCYSARDRDFTFFEIDPNVVDVAQKDFTFLTKCVSAKPPRILVGDGRLELAKLPDKFDLLIVDVFTSDTIPTHIITQEALKSYFDHIKPGGILAMNISNRYFSLWDTIATTSATLGLVTAIKPDLSPVRPFYSSPSLWIVITRPPLPQALSLLNWKPVKPSGRLHPWTDNYTNLLAALSFGGIIQ